MFFERERMQLAIRDLVAHGFEREQILVAPAAEPDPKMEPRSFLGLPHRLHYAGIGAALGMLTGTWLGATPGDETTSTLWFVVAGAVLGVFVGGLVGMAVGGAQRARWHRDGSVPRWAVRVESASDEEAERAVDTLVRHGGTLQPEGTA